MKHLAYLIGILLSLDIPHLPGSPCERHWFAMRRDHRPPGERVPSGGTEDGTDRSEGGHLRFSQFKTEHQTALECSPAS